MVNHYQQLGQNNILRPATNITYVQGETGAKGYPVTNNYTMLLMDSEQQQFFIKSVDAAGIPTMRTFEFTEKQKTEEVKPEYITKEDFENFKEELKELLTPTPKTKKVGEVDG